MTFGFRLTTFSIPFSLFSASFCFSLSLLPVRKIVVSLLLWCLGPPQRRSRHWFPWHTWLDVYPPPVRPNTTSRIHLQCIGSPQRRSHHWLPLHCKRTLPGRVWIPSQLYPNLPDAHGTLGIGCSSFAAALVVHMALELVYQSTPLVRPVGKQ